MAIRVPSGDLYADLGVSPDASAQEISAAFRARARELHPDTNADPAALERFKQLSAAYRVLGDAQARARYDEARRARGRPAAGATSRVETAVAPEPVVSVEPAAEPTILGWHVTRRRAAWLVGCGVGCVVLSVAVALWTALGSGSGDAGRTVTLALVAAKLLVGGLVAIVLGCRRLARHLA
jgi:molecular chaperone DnaJ